MFLITQKGLIKDVADRWDNQYPPETTEPDKAEIGRELRKLNLETATIHDVAKVIGNYSWTRLDCSECGRREQLEVMCVGQEPNYDSATAYLCKECAERALSLFT